MKMTRRITYSDSWQPARKPAWFGERTINSLLFFAALITVAIALLLLVLVISASADTFSTVDHNESSVMETYFSRNGHN